MWENIILSYSKLLWSQIGIKNLCSPSKDRRDSKDSKGRKIIQEALQRNKGCGLQFTGFIFCLLAVKLWAGY